MEQQDRKQNDRCGYKNCALTVVHPAAPTINSPEAMTIGLVPAAESDVKSAM